MFDEVLHLLYVNLRISPNSGELELFVLGKHFIINENLFKDVFGTKFSRVISYILQSDLLLNPTLTFRT